MVRGARMPTEEDGMQPLIRAEMTCSPHEKLGSVVFQQEAVKTHSHFPVPYLAPDFAQYSFTS